MKAHLLSAFSLLVAGMPLTACRQTVGSVIPASVAEMLQSSHMSVTDSLPDWIPEKRSISPLSAAEIAELRTILRPEDVRSVPEKYYRRAEAGNRGDESAWTFYIYADNAQCLGGRVIEGKVLMDDFSLNEHQQTQITELLIPHLRKLRLVP